MNKDYIPYDLNISAGQLNVLIVKNNSYVFRQNHYHLVQILKVILQNINDKDGKNLTGKGRCKRRFIS